MTLRTQLLTRCLPAALMVCPLLSAPALATSFGAGIENSQWYLSESVFECALVHVSNINFASPFQGYLACAGNLLPANFDQLQGSRILFSSASVALNDADRRSLDQVVAYVLADSTVTRVLVDGHTDRTGSRIDNRKLAQDRADAVAGYLKSQGVEGSRIIVRAHGDQFAASGNPAQNRRVVIRMEREGDSTQWQQASAISEPGAG
ncbi:OmpA family protein [Marinobacter gelidimuriae]|uniref:OmpA family protein n=1 Tax=Marinobacter gelidimuriae TaxID=2739064 RepID=UPI000375AC88|nr:OmpA family protein [Marinobacter gelidimuriae]